MTALDVPVSPSELTDENSLPKAVGTTSVTQEPAHANRLPPNVPQRAGKFDRVSEEINFGTNAISHQS